MNITYIPEIQLVFTKLYTGGMRADWKRHKMSIVGSTLVICTQENTWRYMDWLDLLSTAP